MNLDIWPPPPPISTWLAWLVDACGRKWRWMLWLSAWLWSMDISNVCPKAMPDFRPSVLLADIQIPICGKGFWMPVKYCLKYYHEIFTDHIFSVFETAWLSQTFGLCFVCLFWVTRAFFGLELDVWQGALLYWNIRCMCNRDHEWYLMQFMTNAWVSKTFFFHQCIYRILKCNRCQRLYFTSSDQQWYKIYYTLVHWFLTGIRWQLW